MFGNPTFRFTLTHAIYGSQFISEPVGWKEAKLKLERHEDYHSLIEYFEGSFTFYGNNGVDDGGLDFIKAVERIYGVDANIDILIEISFDDGLTFESVFTGLLDLSDIQEVKNNKAEIPIIRNDFWANFINRRETPVNLQDPVDLDGNPRQIGEALDLLLTTQKVRQVYNGQFDQGLLVYDIHVNNYFNEYVQFSPTGIILDEIENSFKIGNLINTERPVWIFELEYSGTYAIDCRIEVSRASLIGIVSTDDMQTGGDYYGKFYIQINDQDPILFTIENFDEPGPATDQSTVYSYLDTFELLKGDIIRIYFLDTIAMNTTDVFFYWGVANDEVSSLAGTFKFDMGQVPSTADNPTYLIITADTIYPESEAEGILLHDAGAAIADRIIGRDNTFYSEYLGSPQTVLRQYFSNGCAWRYFLIRGLQIRGYSLSQKQFSMSFKKWWEGANPILNLGLGYETINGIEVIRVEEKEYFFVPTPLVLIDNVYELMREYDKSRIYKKIEIGYNKWQSEDISGIDDPHTKHTYATRLQKVGTDFSKFSEFIAASIAIEVTRRKTIEKNKDYKFDEDVFIIAIDGNNTSPDRYRPELLEDFNFVTNLLNAETRYNIKLTPARNLLRWIKFLNNGLQSYVGSLYKFTAGEGNYDMTSDMVISTPGCDGDFEGEVLSEKQDIPVTDEYVFIPQEFTAEIDLSWEDYKTIRTYPRNAIGISQTEYDHVAFYIKSLEYQPVQGKAVFKLWPVVPFYMTVPDFVPVNRICEADCADAITDSLSDQLTDELGVCITA